MITILYYMVKNIKYDEKDTIIFNVQNIIDYKKLILNTIKRKRKLL